MSDTKQSQRGENGDAQAQWKSIYILGGIASIFSLIAVVFDIVVGSSTGGNLSALPQTAVDRFTQFQENPWLGLYYLDLLNVVNQMISIPVYFALYAVHRKINKPYALLALVIFLVGTTVFVTTNTALPMLELSRKYATATESRKVLLAAAGEAMLARGSHGSLGVFIGFLLPTIAGLVMSFVMLRGSVFSKANSYMGMVGNALMSVYIVLVTFAPAIKDMTMIFAMPGGLLLVAWMVMATVRLFQLGSSKDSG